MKNYEVEGFDPRKYLFEVGIRLIGVTEKDGKVVFTASAVENGASVTLFGVQNGNGFDLHLSISSIYFPQEFKCLDFHPSTLDEFRREFKSFLNSSRSCLRRCPLLLR